MRSDGNSSAGQAGPGFLYSLLSPGGPSPELRPGELLGLEWGDIDGAVLRLIPCPETFAAPSPRAKNQNALRTVALSSLAIQELEAQRTLTGSAGGLFADASESTIRHRWQTYCDHNGIPYCSLYELRTPLSASPKTCPRAS